MTETTAHDELRNLSQTTVFDKEFISQLRQEFYSVLRALAAIAVLSEELEEDVVDLKRSLVAARDERDAAITSLHTMDRSARNHALAAEKEKDETRALLDECGRQRDTALAALHLAPNPSLKAGWFQTLSQDLEAAETLNRTLYTEKNNVRAMLDESRRQRDALNLDLTAALNANSTQSERIYMLEANITGLNRDLAYWMNRLDQL